MGDIRIRKQDLRDVAKTRECEDDSCSYGYENDDNESCENTIYEDDD